MRRAVALCLLPSFVLAANESDRVLFPSRKVEGRDTVSCENFDIQGRCVTVLTRVDGGAFVSGSQTISVVDNVIACLPASGVDGGCLSASTQSIKGQKTMVDPLVLSQGLTSNGIAYFNAPLYAYPSQQIDLQGDIAAAGAGPDIRLGTQRVRTAGELVSWYNSTSKLGLIDYKGNIVLRGLQPLSSGPETGGTFIDQTCVAGHVSLTSCENLNPTIQGRLGETSASWGWGWDAGLPDGGNPDGGPANTDGGTDYLVAYPYAGLHGDLTIVSTSTDSKNFVLQGAKNGNGDCWWFVDSEMGMGQRNCRAFAAFGGPSPTIQTDKGQYHPFGTLESSLNYGFGSSYNDRRWAWKKSDGTPLDGGWGIIPDRAETLVVVGKSEQAAQFGASALVAGAKTIDFTDEGGADFATVPVCLLTSKTANPVYITTTGTDRVEVAGTTTSGFTWLCVGAK